MSIVTSVVIVASILEKDAEVVRAIESYFTSERATSHDSAHRNALPVLVDGCEVGGWSALQGTLFAGAWNHLDSDVKFLRHLRDRVPWRERETVRVFINREHDDGWTEVALYPLPRPRPVFTIESLDPEYDQDES